MSKLPIFTYRSLLTILNRAVLSVVLTVIFTALFLTTGSLFQTDATCTWLSYSGAECRSTQNYCFRQPDGITAIHTDGGNKCGSCDWPTPYCQDINIYDCDVDPCGGGGGDLQPPQNVSGACSGGNSILVTWTRQNDNGNRYKIARHYHPDGYNINPPPIIVENYAYVDGITNMSYIDTNVPGPGDYAYYIAQCDGDTCSQWSNGTGGVNCPAPTPTPTLATPTITQISCTYPNGPIQLDWTYSTTPTPPYFGIARTNGIDLGLTPAPTPIWNYLLDNVAGSVNQFSDTNTIQPGIRYDYNVRACYDASCAIQGSYANQVYTSCTVKARCDDILPTLAPSPSCWQEGGTYKCWKGATIGGAASGYNGTLVEVPYDQATGWRAESVVRHLPAIAPTPSLVANPLTSTVSYTIPNDGTSQVGDTFEINTNMRWIDGNQICSPTSGGTWSSAPHTGAWCSNTCGYTVEIACNPNESTTTACSPTLADPSVCVQVQTDECGDSTNIPCTCPTPTPTQTSTPTTNPSATDTPPAPTVTPVPPTNTPIPPTPTNTPIPPTPTPTPTTPPQQAMVHGYTYVDQNGDGTNAIVSPGGIGQFSEPALCGVRLIRKNSTNTGLPPNYTDEFAYYCYSKENSGSDTWYKWQTSSTTTQSVYARQCTFDLATKTLRVRDPNHPNVNYRGWYVCNGTLNEDPNSSTGDFVGAGITCDDSSLAGSITGYKPIRIQPKYISYSCPGSYVMSNGSFVRDRSFPPSLISYSDGITQDIPSSSNPFPGMYQLSRTGSSINLQETLLVDQSFTSGQVNPVSIPNQTSISFVTNTTSGPYNFRFLIDTTIPLTTPTPTTPTNTPTPTTTASPTPTQVAWWQQSGGLLYSQNNISSSPPPSPSTYLITKMTSINDFYTAGLPICGGNTLSVTNNNFTENPGSAVTTDPSPNLTSYNTPQNLCAQYNYEYFYNLFSSVGGLDSSESETGGEIPVTTKNQLINGAITIGDLQVKKFTGNMTFSPESTWSFGIDEATAEPEKYLFLLDADASSFANPNGIDPLIEIVPGAFVMFVSRGNINIAPSVGHAPGADVQSLQGVYLTDGNITIESTNDPTTERQFIGAGTFMGCTNLELSRTFDSTVNSSTPAEFFISRPDLLRSAPKVISKPSLTWQEL